MAASITAAELLEGRLGAIRSTAQGPAPWVGSSAQSWTTTSRPARRRALATPGSRLQPPLGLILDEIANMFSWPALPRVMADGGASDVGHLKDLETLLGTRRVRETGHTYHQAGSTTSVHEQLVPVMTVDELRRMPETTGLLAYRTHRGILLDLKGWTQRRDAEQITAGKTSTEAEQQVVFAQQYQDAVAHRRKQGEPR